MRGTDVQQQAMFSYVSTERRVPKSHPLRPIRAMVNQALRQMSEDFDLMYSTIGRPSIPPERLMRASLLQMLYSVRSEQLLMEQLDYNLLFRWFVGLETDDPVWDPSTFSKNRDRFLGGDVSRRFLAQIVAQARSEGLLSDEHFSVDGTLIEAWASMKSVRPKDAPRDDPPPEGRNPTVDFRGEKRSNDTHASVTDPSARMYRKGKGKETKLCYMGHVLMENRNGLVVDACTTLATGKAEREAAVELLKPVAGTKRITVAGDKGYDTQDFVKALRNLRVTPHVAQNTSGRRSAIDARTTRHPGYAVSQRIRKRIEEVFGWDKTVAGLRKVRFRGPDRTNWWFVLSQAAYNLVRMRKLKAAMAT
jgi:transposase